MRRARGRSRASIAGRLGNNAQFAIGASESGNALTSRLAGRDDPAFLVARDPSNGSGFDVDVGGSVAVRQAIGAWGVSLAEEHGDVLTRRDTTLYGLQWKPERFGYDRTTLGIDRRFGGVRAGLSVTRLDEANSVLGARFSGALGAARATSWFLDLGRARRSRRRLVGRRIDAPGLDAGRAARRRCRIGAGAHQRLCR